jgi:PAS domain S-box-containing protein
MSLVKEADPASLATSPSSMEAEAGVIVVESRSTTPLGPKIVYVNDLVCRLSGYDRSSLIGSPLGLLYDRSNLSSLIGTLPVIQSRQNVCFMDRVLMRNGGTRRACRWTIRPTNPEGEHPGYFALTVQPVIPATRRTAASAPAEPVKTQGGTLSSSDSSIARPNLESEKSEYHTSRNESISLAAAGVAHDFKNALQTIKSNLELAAITGPSGTKIQSFINEAQLALGDAEILAGQMLAFTRGEIETSRVIDPGDLLRRVSRLCSAGSGIRCQLFIPPGLRCVVGNPTQIYQVLHNLVINARQAMPSGGTINITAGNADLTDENPYSMPAGRYTVASVKDRGCGMSPEILSRIFEANFTTKREGTGVGLASCKSIVEDHGGAIRVASRVGVGTEFLVFLPSTDARPEAGSKLFHSTPVNQSPKRNPGGGSGRILVVEDQIDVARAAQRLLKHLGYESLHAENGEEAIAIFREHLDSDEPVDAVLLDMTLPGGFSGLEVAQEMLRLDSCTNIVATSGYFEEGAEQEEELSIFSAILPKPYSVASLSEVIESALVP